MKRPLIAASLLALALGGCGRSAGDDTAGNSTANAASTVEVTGSPSSIGANGPSDVSTPVFVEQAAISDMYEIQAAKIALQKAQSNALKVFAQQMITDHGASSAKLKKLVAESGVQATLPTAVDARRAAMIETLTKQGADTFDEEYADQQTTAHRDALGLMNSYATHGDNAALKGFAGELKPKIQMHLETISRLDHAGADEAKGDVTQNTGE